MFTGGTENKARRAACTWCGMAGAQRVMEARWGGRQLPGQESASEGRNTSRLRELRWDGVGCSQETS